MSARTLTPQTLRSLAWTVAAIATSSLVVAVGCGDDAGGSGSGSTQGGGSGATESSGAVGPDTSSPSATSGSGDGGATSGTAASVVTGVTQGPGPVAVSSSASGSGGEGGSGLAGCDPPVGADEIYGRVAIDYVSLQETRLCDYRDQVLLIVNVAAK